MISISSMSAESQCADTGRRSSWPKWRMAQLTTCIWLTSCLPFTRCVAPSHHNIALKRTSRTSIMGRSHYITRQGLGGG